MLEYGQSVTQRDERQLYLTHRAPQKYNAANTYSPLTLGLSTIEAADM